MCIVVYNQSMRKVQWEALSHFLPLTKRGEIIWIMYLFPVPTTIGRGIWVHDVFNLLQCTLQNTPNFSHQRDSYRWSYGSRFALTALLSFYCGFYNNISMKWSVYKLQCKQERHITKNVATYTDTEIIEYCWNKVLVSV